VIDGAVFDDYWAAVAKGDGRTAIRVAMRQLEDGVPLPDVLDQLVAAGQAEVGKRWAANEWNVAQEHRATSVSEEVVAALSAIEDLRPDQVGRIVVTCADGEWHALPSRILTASLRHAGWDVTFLGASVPARHLRQLLHDVGPEATALSCMLPVRLFHAREMIEVSRDAGVPVLIGGRGFGPSGRWGLTLGANAWAPTASAATELLAGSSLPAFTDPAPALSQPDNAVDDLRRNRDRYVDWCMRDLSIRRLPDVTSYSQHQLARTEEDFGHIIDFLAASLYVDDNQLFEEFVGWLDDILVARGVPTSTISVGLEIVTGVVGSVPRTIDVLAAGLAVLDSRR